ncbi:hypothetical protein MPTA5024_22725 [Microbispora sp. ATCC PTA-5024]|nr:hypothetical protein MPTA5024_22725 [Microbispora sp. ATCC PTA-5024]
MVEFRLLGPVTVLDEEGTPLDAGPSQQRAVLALCLLAAPRPVSTAAVIGALWPGGAPRGAVTTVQAYVSKLRRVLEPGRTRRSASSVLVSRPGGYAMEIPAGALDLTRATARLAEGRRLLTAGDHAGGSRELRLALSEWRGEPLTGFESEAWARDEITHLTELRLTILEDAAEADLARGLGPELVPELARLTGAHPLRERLRRLHAHALYQAGRQAEALAFLAEGRRVLVTELGLDPDPRSRELERRILAQDPSLTPRASAAPVAADGRLVGRAAEHEVLRRAAGAGEDRIVLLAGEPGIGKTALADEAARLAPRSATGRCWDGPGAPPFWPWAQAVRRLTGRRGELAEMLGAKGEFALYDAFARLMGDVGRVLVVLDDIHWADPSSLRLLEFLATTRPCPGLTVVATYRDTEVGASLARTLGTLVRLPQVERVTLGGLGEDDVAEYLRRAGADAARAAEVARRTGGNPFFLGEVAHLGEDAPGAVADVVAARVAALPPGAPEVLAAAALLGREAGLDVLLDVAGVPRDAALDVLDAAVRARLLVERDLVYRFAHDIVREALRDGLPPLGRRRVHARIAAALERRGAHPAELAHHYREGLPVSGTPEVAIACARRAAAHATAQFAHEDAAGHLREAVALVDRLSPADPALHCDLLLDLADALAAAGSTGRAHAALQEAAGIAARLGDDERLARAALGRSDPLSWAGYEEWAAGGSLAAGIEAALRAQRDDRSPWRAQLLAASAVTGYFSRPVEESVALASEAVRLARRRGDDRALLRGLSAYEILSRGVAAHAERQAAIDEMAEVAARTGDLVAEWLAREAEYFELVKQGETAAADPLLEWLTDTARRVRQPALLSLAAWLSAVRAYLGGDLDRALAEAVESARVHPEGGLGRDDAELRARVFRCVVARARGDAARALDLAGRALEDRPGQPGWRVLRCAALLDLGRRAEAAEAFAALARDGFADVEGDLAYRFIPDLLSEVCLSLASADDPAVRAAVDAGRAAADLRDRLAPNAGRLLGWSVADLCLGRLALALGEREEAAARLRSALGFVRRSGALVYERAVLDLLAEL